MTDIVDDGFYWLLDSGEWTIGQAVVWSADEASFYLIGQEYPRDMREFEVGERIFRSVA